MGGNGHKTRRWTPDPFCNFLDVNPILRSVFPDANISDVRHLALDLRFLHNGSGREFLLRRLRRLRLRFVLDSLTITWRTTITQVYHIYKTSIPIKLIKSLIVHKRFIFDLRPLQGDEAHHHRSSLIDYRTYQKLAPWATAMRNIFMPYTLMEGYNRPFLEHESFGLERLFKEERDELDERLAYLKRDKAVVKFGMRFAKLCIFRGI